MSKTNRDISKLMSYALRHRPDELGITLDEQGWTDTYELLVAIQHRHPNATMDDLIKIVQDSDKQRFQIQGSRIRANQGHSVTLDLGLTPQTPPAILYHGTSLVILDIVQRDGLKKMGRHHVHLSPDIETARIVAARRPGTTVILHVDTNAMTTAGHEFYVSDNGVWLTDHVPPEFIGVLVKSHQA